MNMVEALSREIARVSAIYEQALGICISMGVEELPAEVKECKDRLERAHVAIASNDAIEVIQSYKELQGIQ